MVTWAGLGRGDITGSRAGLTYTTVTGPGLERVTHLGTGPGQAGEPGAVPGPGQLGDTQSGTRAGHHQGERGGQGRGGERRRPEEDWLVNASNLRGGCCFKGNT